MPADLSDCGTEMHGGTPFDAFREPIPQWRHSYLRHEALAAALAAEPPLKPGALSRPTLRHFVAVASEDSEHNVPVPGTAGMATARQALSSQTASAATAAAVAQRSLTPWMLNWGGCAALWRLVQRSCGADCWQLSRGCRL